MRLDKQDLQRSFDRFDAPEPAFDRLLQRRKLRERRRRVQAAVVALAVVGVTGALIGRSFLMGEPLDQQQPATPPACDRGAWDAPSPSGNSGAVLAAVATSDVDTYVVVQNHDGPGHSLLHHGADGWSTVSTPSPGFFVIAAPASSGTRPSPLWLLSDDAVWVLRSGAWSSLPRLPLVGDDHATALSVASAQDVWVGTSGGTVLRFDGSSWVPSSPPDGDRPSRLLALGPADVWIGGERGGSGPPAPFTAHWDGKSWTDVTVPSLSDASVMSLVASGSDVWLTVESSGSDGQLTTHLLHLQNGAWDDTATLEGDAYRFNVLAGGASGIWSYRWTTQTGPPTSIDHWTGTSWERTVPVPKGWDLGGHELWQFAAMDVTSLGADVVRMGGNGIVDFHYAC